MLKYEYKNAIVYITKPTEKHLQNIRKATEKFMQRVMKEKIQNEGRRYNRRVSINDPNARQRNKRIEI